MVLTFQCPSPPIRRSDGFEAASNPFGLDRLGTLKRWAGEAAVYIGAQHGPRRNQLKDIDPEMEIEADHHIGRREARAEQPGTFRDGCFEHIKDPVKIAEARHPR